MNTTGMLTTQVHIPGPLGMILAGMALKNIRSGFIITGLRASWSKQLRGAALAIIFLRSGLELDLGVRFFLGHHFPVPSHIICFQFSAFKRPDECRASPA